MKQYEPAIGDVVTFDVNGKPESGEVTEILAGSAVGVRVTELGSEFEGQRVYFNAGNLQPVTFGGR